MRLLKVLLAVFLGFSSLTGCGTLVRGTTETYRVISDPEGALAVFSSGEVCTTPCAVEKKRDEPFSVRIEKEGYLPFDVQVEEQTCDGTEATTLGNLLMVGSVLWASIDSLSGANKELTPNPCQVTLVPFETQPEG